ncbi:MAG: type II secretion system protein GspN [Methylotenera sp.]|nr:type II secretion system protein GspN [Oligoflexia bacterium]
MSSDTFEQIDGSQDQTRVGSHNGPETPPSRAQTILRALGWSTLALGCLFFFTLVNLPQARIKNFIQGTLTNALSTSGIQMTSSESNLSMGLLGLGYELKNVTLKKPPSEAALTIEGLSVTPKLTALILGQLGAKLSLNQGDGFLKASYAGKGSEMSLSFDGKDLNLGKMGVLPYFAGIKGTAQLAAEGSVSGDSANPATLNGNVKFNLNKIVIDSQKLYGFDVPRLAISEGVIDLQIAQGKATITSFRLGKAGSMTDDIVANATGDFQLAKQMELSTINVKAKFTLSQNILKAFSLIDALLGAGKLPDGSYSYTLTGQLLQPTPTPAK